MPLVLLTDLELKIIESHRREIKRQKELAEKQMNCVHWWQYSGHGHNDDCYTCKKCGATKWE